MWETPEFDFSSTDAVLVTRTDGLHIIEVLAGPVVRYPVPSSLDGGHATVHPPAAHQRMV